MVGNMWDSKHSSPTEYQCIIWLKLSKNTMLYVLNQGLIGCFGRGDRPDQEHWVLR